MLGISGLDAQLPRPPLRRRGGWAGARAVGSAVSGTLPVPRWQRGICDATVMARASAGAFPLCHHRLALNSLNRLIRVTWAAAVSWAGRKNLLVNLLHTWSEIPRVLDKPSRQTLLSILLYVRFLINLATMQNSLRPS